VRCMARVQVRVAALSGAVEYVQLMAHVVAVCNHQCKHHTCISNLWNVLMQGVHVALKVQHMLPTTSSYHITG
jgi:hypothetical protein